MTMDIVDTVPIIAPMKVLISDCFLTDFLFF